ncbi:hypothetical protein FHG87_016946 [Trinorchestia longiramus]|nr:hypothetical protein FHG87_016946 [Trinorchestia longiramus]
MARFRTRGLSARNRDLIPNTGRRPLDHGGCYNPYLRDKYPYASCLPEPLYSTTPEVPVAVAASLAERGLSACKDAVDQLPQLSHLQLAAPCQSAQAHTLYKVLIMGDFNLPYTNWTIRQSRAPGFKRTDLITTNSLQQHVNEPTGQNNIPNLFMTTPDLRIIGLEVTDKRLRP